MPLIPSLLLPEVYGPWKAEPGFIAAQIAKAAAEGFYRSVEIGPIPYEQDRATIRGICADKEIQVSAWLTQIVDEEKLDLNAIDEDLRRRSVDVIKRSLPIAVESGAGTVAFVGGADPGPHLREKGYDSFVTSMVTICDEAANLGLNVMFEPLDRFAHKKRLIGPTAEAVVAIGRVRETHPGFGLAFDTAHVALNQEEIGEALALASDQVLNLHLSNAVIDPSDPLYGDYHMMPGAPGFLTLDKAASILSDVLRLGIGGESGLRVAIEARARPDDDRQATANLATTFLREAMMRVSI